MNLFTFGFHIVLYCKYLVSIVSSFDVIVFTSIEKCVFFLYGYMISCHNVMQSVQKSLSETTLSKVRVKMFIIIIIINHT